MVLDITVPVIGSAIVVAGAFLHKREIIIAGAAVTIVGLFTMSVPV